MILSALYFSKLVLLPCEELFYSPLTADEEPDLQVQISCLAKCSQLECQHGLYKHMEMG